MSAETSIQRQYHELESAIMRNVYPEAVYDEQYGEWAMPDGNGGFFLKAPSLEDVLRAMATGRELWAVTPLGQFVYIDKSNLSTRLATCVWILGKPLSDQSDECKKFLHSLLKE